MNRPSIRYGVALVMVLLVAVLPNFGCRSALATAMYLVKGTDVEPDFKGLKEKKVAVVCRPLVSLQYRNANAGRNLAKQITLLLQEKVPKIKTIDQRKVNNWTDENMWQEYAEVGQAVGADMVVGIDLESFSIFQGQTLYQGKANATIRVFDCATETALEDGPIFEKIIPQSVYPPNSAVPTSDRTEPEFRREFIHVLADQIARHFYAHDPHADMTLDTTALRQ